MKKILLIHGPNLNMLGVREPDTYGIENFSDINNMIENYSKTLNVKLEIFQSNTEGEIVNKIQSALNNYNGIIINPAAYTHTSVAIADAIAAVNIPTIEVHLSNIYAREEFRHHSFIAPVCIGQISGFKSLSYKLALDAIVQYLNNM